MNADHLHAVLNDAVSRAGLTSDRPAAIRIGENAIFRLRPGVVARISRQGQLETARKEVAVARWLQKESVQAVRVLGEIQQPISVCGHAVTFWHELPPHENGSRVELAASLRSLHQLPVPREFELPLLAPFEGLAERIESAATFSDAERQWLRRHLDDLRAEYDRLPQGKPHSVLHGDAWPGNIVRSTGDGEILVIDLERFSVGPPEWDLLHTAISYATVGKLSHVEYAEFVDVYGLDVLDWSGYPTLRDIRELRLTLFAAQMAAENSQSTGQASHRLACLKGELGERPWKGWEAVP
ncbi:aminoglycoside phosphotransferase family protein [Lentzea sp. BCCO 10_0856]|uniref:Aminoglycoside phosphotransferase family protein n=1 Tax=Lentzea miocenica TaxID=3095431 RepID=A0ABU4THI4_9PSEU|nr:aminoglycoside phosphotransferase family protein [Lentzea sp. BCCO 10_0856]MDX8037633.1 aminoglycoside phosphotransferase family protein [Lentzea sp. BCCO 10_0856]